MHHFRYGLIADAVFDAPNGKKNIMGVFTNLNATAYPCQFRFSAFIRIEGDQSSRNKTAQFEFELVDADHKQITPPIKGKLLFPNTQKGILPGVEIVLNFENLPIPTAGEYELLIRADSRYLGSVPFRAVQASQPQAG